MRQAVRWALGAVLVIGLASLLSVRAESWFESGPASAKSVDRLTIGSPWPWLDRRTEMVQDEGRVLGETRVGGVRLVTPAWLLLCGLIGCGWVLVRLRPKETGRRHDGHDQANLEV